MWHQSRNWEEVLKLSSQRWSTVDNWSWSIEQKNEQRDTKEWKAALWVEHTAHRVTAGRKGDKPHRADAPSKDTLPDDSTPDFFFLDHDEGIPEKSWHEHLRGARMTQMMEDIPWTTVMRMKKTKDGSQKHTGCWFNRADTVSEQNKRDHTSGLGMDRCGLEGRSWVWLLYIEFKGPNFSC